MSSKVEAEELRRLLSLACDGRLDDEGAEKIEEMLRLHPEWCDKYAAFMATEALLEVSCGKSALASSLPNVDRAEAMSPSPEPSPAGSFLKRLGRPSGFDSWRSAAITLTPYVAAAALLVGVGVWLVSRPGARLVAVNEARWADGQDRDVGAPIGRDWRVLDEGFIRVAFRSGVMATIQAPARFRATSSNSSELDYGAITARVPETARGFSIGTPDAEVTDLGTGFRLQVDRSGDLGLHVTEGEVRIEQRSGRRESVTLQAGQIATTKHNDDALLVHSAESLRSSRNVVYYDQHPVSLGYDSFDRDDQFSLFLESHRVRLQERVRLNVAKTGRHDQTSEVAGYAEAGQVVDCYLIHSAPKKRRHDIKGSVTFPGKILGIVSESVNLNATNEVLGSSWSLLCRHPERGLESRPDLNYDEVTISGDRRTLTLRTRTQSIDQLRVLVSAE